MKKKIIIPVLFCFAFLIPYSAYTQSLGKIAYINSVELLEVVPGKGKATKTISDLNHSYKEELQQMQNEYDMKYSDFITYQNTMAESIMLRRMQELYELEKNINNFILLAQKDIETQEQNLIEPLRLKLKEAIEEVGREQGYTCIYDMANPTIAFITPDAIDVNLLVKRKLLEKR